MDRLTTKNLLIFFFTGYAIYMIYQFNIQRKEILMLSSNNTLTFGWITDFGYQAGGASISAQYQFRLKRKKYIDNFGRSNFCKKLSSSEKRMIKTHKFPIVYLPDDPTINRIVLSKSDYIKYGIPYPDSLSGFLDLYFNCDD